MLCHAMVWCGVVCVWCVCVFGRGGGARVQFLAILAGHTPRTTSWTELLTDGLPVTPRVTTTPKPCPTWGELAGVACCEGTRDVVWCGVVWCGVVWCGVVWCGVVWCGVVWCGVVWCGVVWCGVVWCGVVWCGVVWSPAVPNRAMLCVCLLHTSFFVLLCCGTRSDDILVIQVARKARISVDSAGRIMHLRRSTYSSGRQTRKSDLTRCTNA